MNLLKALQNSALNTPQMTSIHFQGRDYSYEEVNQHVQKLASSLQKLGIQKGDNIALILGNTPHFVISMYACFHAGVTVVPINPIYTPAEISYIVNNADVKAIITLDVLFPLMEKLSDSLSNIEHVILCETSAEKVNTATSSLKDKCYSFMELVISGNCSSKAVEVQNDETAVILYTSGTTGKPKGAMLTHENLYSNARDVATFLNFKNGEKILVCLPMFHVFALTVCVNAPIVSSSTMVIQAKFSPKEVFELIENNGITIFAGVPTMYNFIYQYSEGFPEIWKNVRTCVSGGASLPVSLLENFEKKFSVTISEGYGLSEASPVTNFNPIDRPRKAGSIGTSINNVETKIVNVLGEEVATGEVGELIIRGPNVMKGYYGMPEETENTIRNGWLYTGDLARADEDGYFYIVDRKKDLVIVGGYNVYPREVEEVLYQHPGIVEAAVAGVPDPEQGESVRAFVVLKDKSLTEQDILDYCKERLAKYKLPKEVIFLDELPKNTTGKILRMALREMTTEK